MAHSVEYAKIFGETPSGYKEVVSGYKVDNVNSLVQRFPILVSPFPLVVHYIHGHTHKHTHSTLSAFVLVIARQLKFQQINTHSLNGKVILSTETPPT